MIASTPIVGGILDETNTHGRARGTLLIIATAVGLAQCVEL